MRRGGPSPARLLLACFALSGCGEDGPGVDLRPVSGSVLVDGQPEAGVVVGRVTNPVAPTGARIVHLGHVAEGDAIGHPS